MSDMSAAGGNTTSGIDGGDDPDDIANSVPVINDRECSGHIAVAGVISGKPELQASNIQVAIIEVPAKFNLKDKDPTKLIEALAADSTVKFKVRTTGEFENGSPEHSDLHNSVFKLKGVPQDVLKARLENLKKGDELKLVMFGETAKSSFAVVGRGKITKKAASKNSPTEQIIAQMTTSLISESRAACLADDVRVVCETSCEERVDPLILDIKNNGIAFTDRDRGVKFDINAVGRLQKISWTTRNSDDAFLFMDLNGNSKVDDGSELFSNSTVLADNFYAADGFKALAAIDSNHDGLIDSRDAAFESVGLWIDSNGNGLSEASELEKLSKYVESISLNYSINLIEDKFGNLTLGTTKVKMKGLASPVSNLADVWFAGTPL